MLLVSVIIINILIKQPVFARTTFCSNDIIFTVGFTKVKEVFSYFESDEISELKKERKTNVYKGLLSL